MFCQQLPPACYPETRAWNIEFEIVPCVLFTSALSHTIAILNSLKPRAAFHAATGTTLGL